MTRQRPAWGAASALLAALALGACSKPQDDSASQAARASSGALSGDQASGAGLKGGLGTGLTGSFPNTSTSTSTHAATGSMGNAGLRQP
jgi:hypothetical protein